MAFMELDSRALRAASPIVAQSVWLGDGVVTDRPVMGLTARRFRFTSGVSEGPWEIEGYTAQQPPYQAPDVRTPTLHLDGQRFFDRAHTSERTDVLALVGGPPASPPPGFSGHYAHVISGSRRGEPVRPFALEGADRVLDQAVHNLAGFNARLTPELVQRIIDVGHPLVVVDALRVAADEGHVSDEFQRLAAHLLHPGETPEAKVIALQVIARKLKLQAPGSNEANALVALASRAWQFERQHRIAEGYLQLWAGAREHVERYPRSGEVIAMALDDTAAERVRRLRESLQQESGKNA